MAISGIRANLGDVTEPWVNLVEKQLREANAAIAKLTTLVAQLSKGQ